MKRDNINRRNFLKKIGLGATAVAATSALSSCGKGASTLLSPEGSHTLEVPKDKMTYRTSNVNGDKISILGYGCMRWLTKDNPNDPTKRVLDQERVNELIDYALEHGINYFDTAPVYGMGQSETVTGIALSRHPRESYRVATKLSNQRIPAGLPPKETFRRSVEMYHNSMKSLQIDYIDYYLLHSIGGGRDSFATLNYRFFDNGVLDFLVEEKKAGRIRNLGFSFHGDVRIFDHMLKLHDEGKYRWDFVQIQMNYLDWRHASNREENAEYLYNELTKRGIQAIIMEPLLGGRLSNLPQYVIQRLKSQKPQDSVASWAFRWVGSFDNILTVLSGMTYMEHLQDNIRTYSPLEKCSEADFEYLEETADIISKYPLIPCNNCEYCMPCPYGIDIPGVLLHYNKCVNEGNITQSVDDDNYKKARRAFLIGYDRSVPKLRQADHCINCRKCIDDCPQRIAIPVQLRRISKYVDELRGDGVI